MVKIEKKALVIGGAGSLGQSLISMLLCRSWVASIDVKSRNSDGLFMPHVEVNPQSSLDDQFKAVEKGLTPNVQFNAIYCVAGGFLMGNAADGKFLSSCSTLWKMNMESSFLAASLASKYLAKNGLLMLTGAAAALNPTPAMIGYGVSKSAIHALVKSLAMKESGIDPSIKVAAILPYVLDTPSNRQAMPDVDTSTWTPLSHLSEELARYGEDPLGIQKNGDLILVKTVKGSTSFSSQSEITQAQ